MSAESPPPARRFSAVDARRAALILGLFALVAVGYWYLLPVLQSFVLPTAPGGRDGPWVVRPIQAFRFGAMAVMTAVTLPLVDGPLRRRWKREDAALGTRFDPFQGSPTSRLVLTGWGLLLLSVYVAGLAFYLLSWDVIGPDGIEVRLPWGTRTYSYQDVASLETIPEGMRSEEDRRDGPWYAITLKNGRVITLSLDNEGTTRDELEAMTAHVAARTGLTWVRRRDLRSR